MIANKACLTQKIDDATVKFVFDAPYALFLENMATPLGQYPTLYPKHYAQPVPSKIQPRRRRGLAKAANVPDWGTLFRNKCGDIEIPTRWGNPEKPVLDPWVIEEPYSGGATRVSMRRNPYFWQVDTAGNQLPYVDAINFGISQDVESLMLDVISGQARYPGPAYRHAAEQADAVAEHGEGRLPPDRVGQLRARSSARSIST